MSTTTGELQHQTPLDDCQVVLVIGGSQGIGLALVKNLLLNQDSNFTTPDCRVVATIRSPNVELEALCNEYPGRLYIETVDLADTKSIENFAQRVQAKFNRLDLYIHNAGVLSEPYRSRDDPRIDIDAYFKTHMVNVIAPQHCFCLLLPLLNRTHELLGGALTTTRPSTITLSQPFKLNSSPENINNNDPKEENNEEKKEFLGDNDTKVRILFISSEMASITCHPSGYSIPIYAASKSALNQHVRDLAHYYPYLSVHVCHPGWVQTSLSPRGKVMPIDSARGIIKTWNEWGYASRSMEKMFKWDGGVVPY